MINTENSCGPATFEKAKFDRKFVSQVSNIDLEILTILLSESHEEQLRVFVKAMCELYSVREL